MAEAPKPTRSHTTSSASLTSQDEFSAGKALLKLLRLPTNRICADCSSPLLDSHNIWCSLGAPPVPFGVFTCVACMASHRAIGAPTLRVKNVHTSYWALAEIRVMQDWGNEKSNKVLECYVGTTKFKDTPDPLSSRDRNTHRDRNTSGGDESDEDSDADSLPFSPPLPPNIAPPSHSFREASLSSLTGATTRPPPVFKSLLSSQSSPHDREHYIRSKYQSLAFVFPNGPISQGLAPNQTGLQSSHGDKSTMPTQFIDYFCTIGTKFIPSTFSPPPDLTKVSSLTDYPFPPDVVDCYPPSHPKSPNPLPDHISHFVFPNHLKPSLREHPPLFFTFVLTNANGMKVYASCMHIWEDVEAAPLLKFIKEAHANDKFKDGESKPAWLDTTNPTDILFLPRALVLLSHYPFYDSHRQYLQQLYRISLSAAPLPLERYIANYVKELPLPPKGRVDLKYGIADKTITMTRPPPNKLPLNDFSYRPLFSTLSIPHILTLWSYLLVENRVAICSKYYSLLTPVCEALLSALFPFVWQGAYIPVMPSAMTDILDAPVPFIVGLHGDYLANVKPEFRPVGVIFVDLDRDEVHLGFDEMTNKKRQTLSAPEKEMTKLREKLEESVGGVLLAGSGEMYCGNAEVLPYTHRDPYAIPGEDKARAGGRGSGDESSSKDRRRNRRDRDKVLEVSDLAFPNNEHLLPINHFATEQGMVLRKGRASGKQGGDAERGGMGGGEANKLSLLDTALNETGHFSSNEIRNAFLRFFVSVLRHYDKHVSTTGKPFNRDAFMKDSSHLNHESHDFTINCCSSQMFERFIEERISNPNQPEIMFFNESIVQKINRSVSVTRGKKKATPFLSDNSDVVSETFSPPPPSNWGLPDDGRLYSYPNFPNLDFALFGNVRAPRQLQKAPEQQRTVNGSAHAMLLERSEGSSRLLVTGGMAGALGGKKGLMDKPRSMDLEWALHLLVYGENLITQGAKQNITMSHKKEANTIIEAERMKQVRGADAVFAIQSRSRMIPVKRKFVRMKAAAKFIQKFYRRELILRTYREVYLDVLKIVKIVQKVFRGWLGRVKAGRRYGCLLCIQARMRGVMVRESIRLMGGCCTKIQAAERGRRARFAFAVISDLVIVAQANVRGWFKRKIADKQRRARLAEYREQIFKCWKRAHTPLAYRSKFWLLFDGSGFLHVAVHEDELLRLWRDLGVFNSDAGRKLMHTVSTLSSGSGGGDWGDVGEEGGVGDVLNLYSPNGGSLSFYKRFKSVGELLASVEGDEEPVFASEVAAGRGDKDKSMLGKHLVVAAERLKLERMQLYEKMKYSNSDSTKSAYYSMFKLKEGDKKKKQRLCGFLWEEVGLGFESAQVVLGVSRGEAGGEGAGKGGSKGGRWGGLGGGRSGMAAADLGDAGSWVQQKLEKRIKQDLLSTVQACIVSIQSFKVKEREERRAGWRGSGREKYGRFGSGFSPEKGGEEGGDGSWVEERRDIISRYRGVGSGGGKSEAVEGGDEGQEESGSESVSGSSASGSSGGSSLDWTENPLPEARDSEAGASESSD